MAKKKAVGKAAKAPTPTHLTAQIRSDKAKEATLKHEAADARRPAVRKHDLAQAASIGKKITSLKHERAERKAKRKAGLALAPGDVNCCAAQALAASLRLALGVAVHEEDVLTLYWRTAADPDEGASILDTLRAAREYGLSGARPAHFGALLPGRSSRPGPGFPDAVSVPGCRGLHQFPSARPGSRAMVLHLDLPEGPHAVTVGPDGTWWSWGEPYSPEDFGGADIAEAWAVSWE
jgi:hypothetical protein